jgi:large subunit ribosomal protein L24
VQASCARRLEGGAGVKVKKGDTVEVIAGRDKGARGKVIAAYPRDDRILVEGVNRVRKHTRIRTSQRGAKSGGIITQEAAIHVSNVMVVDSDGRPTRIGYRVDENGRKVRVSRRNGKDLA